jgi:hypothetical protein
MAATGFAQPVSARSRRTSNDMYHVLADSIVVVHLAFVVFVLFGGLLVFWKPRIAWAHVPAVAWGTWIEFAGWICPLTPLENWLRAQGGGTAYTSSFVDRYLMPVLYPPALTREVQWALGGAVVIVNAVIYTILIRGGRHTRAAQ